ncbi:unnamed protein product [Owenia fusiformis]|uniref:Uncharacterized protein n=1 Tax=Owenia fusiformis TaxID=6347 RepID=A0A8S4PDN5_OWEFU|nr:unnamed protein product [Owenia fusiformis]
MKNTYNKEIVGLKKDISLLEGIVQSILFRINRTTGPVLSPTNESNPISVQSQVTVSSTTSNDPNKASSDPDMSKATNLSIKTVQSADQPQKTFVDKQTTRAPSNESQTFYPEYLKDHDTDFPQLPQRTGALRTRSRSESAVPSSYIESQDNQIPRADTSTQNWNEIVAKKKSPVKMVPFKPLNAPSKNRDNAQTTRTKRGLRGIAFERSKTLYLENICQEESESDDDTIKIVKEHANSKDIKILQVYVVHNRVNSYRVGCKIIVPLSTASKAMESDMWPTPIACREWRTRPYTDRRSDQLPPRLRYSNRRQENEDRRQARPPYLDRDDDDDGHPRSYQSRNSKVYEYDHSKDPRSRSVDDNGHNRIDWYDRVDYGK